MKLRIQRAYVKRFRCCFTAKKLPVQSQFAKMTKRFPSLPTTSRKDKAPPASLIQTNY